MKKIEVIGKRVRVHTVNNEPSKTQQQFVEQCDVNNIIAKYKQTGEFTHLARKKGVFADVSNITDYQESMHKVLDAQNAFMALNSDIRLRFGNDPAQLLSFLQDPANYDEGVKLGLFEPKPDFSAPQNKNDLNETKTKKPKKEEQLDLTQPDKT